MVLPRVRRPWSPVSIGVWFIMVAPPMMALAYLVQNLVTFMVLSEIYVLVLVLLTETVSY